MSEAARCSELLGRRGICVVIYPEEVVGMVSLLFGRFLVQCFTI